MEINALIVTVLLGLLGYFATYFYNLRLARRADRLKFINAQMDELYGPLYVITQTGRGLYLALVEKGLRQGKLATDQDAAEVVSEWRIWIENVFQPLNEQLEYILVNKAHLVIEEEFPQSMKRFLIHSAGYKAVISKWEMGNYSESGSIIEFPAELADYAKTSYQTLRREQLKLIGHRTRPPKEDPAEEEPES